MVNRHVSQLGSIAASTRLGGVGYASSSFLRAIVVYSDALVGEPPAVPVALSGAPARLSSLSEEHGFPGVRAVLLLRPAHDLLCGTDTRPHAPVSLLAVGIVHVLSRGRRVIPIGAPRGCFWV